MELIYLDNNATTRPVARVCEAVSEAHEALWANPSSVHRAGQQVRQRVELARQSVAGLIGAKPREIIFTSGGTESNNLALRGVLAGGAPGGSGVSGGGGASGGRVLITTPVEHSAVREPAEALEAGGEAAVVYLPVDEDGLVEPAALRDAVVAHAVDGGVVLVSIIWANNETGAIQPMAALGEAVRDARAELAERGTSCRVWFHTDATQAVGKIDISVSGSDAGVDLLTLSAHKFHGPKGAGALWRRSRVRLQPVQRGGPQERELRGGTENTPGIIGMGVAAELAQRFVTDQPRIDALAALRDRFEARVRDAAGDMGVAVNAGDAPRLWNTSNLGFARLEAEAILVGLSERGVCASAGAACSSGSLEPSPVLRAMGVPEPVAHGSVRFSLSRDSTEAEVDRAAAVVGEVVGRLSRTLPMGA